MDFSRKKEPWQGIEFEWAYVAVPFLWNTDWDREHSVTVLQQGTIDVAIHFHFHSSPPNWEDSVTVLQEGTIRADIQTHRGAWILPVDCPSCTFVSVGLNWLNWGQATRKHRRLVALNYCVLQLGSCFNESRAFGDGYLMSFWPFQINIGQWHAMFAHRSYWHMHSETCMNKEGVGFRVSSFMLPWYELLSMLPSDMSATKAALRNRFSGLYILLSRAKGQKRGVEKTYFFERSWT